MARISENAAKCNGVIKCFFSQLIFNGDVCNSNKKGAWNVSIRNWKNIYFNFKMISFIVKFRLNYAICYGRVLVHKGGLRQNALFS